MRVRVVLHAARLSSTLAAAGAARRAGEGPVDRQKMPRGRVAAPGAESVGRDRRTDALGTCQKQSETIIAFARVPPPVRSVLRPTRIMRCRRRSCCSPLYSDEAYFVGRKSAGRKILGFCPAGGLN